MTSSKYPCDRENWLREKEWNLHLRFKARRVAGYTIPHDLGTQASSLLLSFRNPWSRLEACVPRINWSRWKELNRHRSIINRVLWPLSYTAMVDPTGLKPAPHGLKGRRSVTRAPGQRDWLWRKDSNLR